MKKTLIILLALIFMLSGCKKNDDTPPPPESAEPSNEAIAPSETVPPTDPLPSETEPEPTQETTPQPEQPVFAENGYTPKAVMYHLIMEEPYSIYEALFVRPNDFSEELDALNEEGYTYLFADEFEKTAEKSVALTFDDGYEDNYTTMFPILKEHGAKATVFLITDLLDTDGYLTTEQVKEMAASGYVRFGSHTVSHYELASQSDETVEYQLSKSKEIIESITGMPCNSMAYPAGSHSGSVMNIAAKYFDYAYTTKSPNSVTEYTKMNIPRVYAARSLNRYSFMSLID